MSKPVILTFVRHYLPGHRSGGPVRTISNMVDALGDEFEFRIVTSDRDALDEKPYDGIKLNDWNAVGKAAVCYVSPDRQNVLQWGRIMRQVRHDLLYFNSLFDPLFTVMPLVAQKVGFSKSRVVIAPRGELSPGALELKKTKKMAYLRAARMLGVYGDVVWHASAEEEARLIRNNFPSSRHVVVARNLPASLQPPELVPGGTDASEPLRIVFLSRICRMKNLDFALQVLRDCRVVVRFDIWGMKEDAGYWKECSSLISSMPANVTVEYRGEVEHSKVTDILSGYHLFFLPTRGENYGHAIAEAVSAGIPLLISDQTPWRGLAEKDAGWDLPLGDPAPFLQAIEEAASRIGSGDGISWRRKVYRYAKEKLGNPQLQEDNRKLFTMALQQS